MCNNEIKYEPKTDCFAYRNGRFDATRAECGCLTEMLCVNKGKCSFYKPKPVKKEDENGDVE